MNADPRVFYVADPCRMGGGPEALGAGACSLSVSRLLACQPTLNDIRNLFSFSYIVERVRCCFGVQVVIHQRDVWLCPCPWYVERAAVGRAYRN